MLEPVPCVTRGKPSPPRVRIPWLFLFNLERPFRWPAAAPRLPRSSILPCRAAGEHGTFRGIPYAAMSETLSNCWKTITPARKWVRLSSLTYNAFLSCRGNGVIKRGRLLELLGWHDIGAIHVAQVPESGWPRPLPPPIGCNLSTNRKRKPKWRRCVAASIAVGPSAILRAHKRLVVANGTSERPDTVMTMAGV